MTEQEKAYYELQKVLVDIQQKLEKYNLAGISPPENLLQQFEQVKRRLHIFSKVRDKAKNSWLVTFLIHLSAFPDNLYHLLPYSFFLLGLIMKGAGFFRG